LLKDNGALSERLNDWEPSSSQDGESPGRFEGRGTISPTVQDYQIDASDVHYGYPDDDDDDAPDRFAFDRFAFDPVLMSSRVYRSTKDNELDPSLPGSSKRSARSSAFSELSLGDISAYNVVGAPVHPAPELSATRDMPGMGDMREAHRGGITVTTTIDVTFSYGGQLTLEEESEPDAGPPEINGGTAFTVADSGYGTASKAGTTAAPLPLVQEDADLDDIASVITDNMSLDLPEDVGNIYVREFVERILDATTKLPTQEAQREQLILMLPNLLRAFALRVSFAEKTAEGNAVGVFTRKYRE
jgi:hypothetical protein